MAVTPTGYTSNLGGDPPDQKRQSTTTPEAMKFIRVFASKLMERDRGNNIDATVSTVEIEPPRKRPELDRLCITAGVGLPDKVWRDLAASKTDPMKPETTTHTVEPFVRAQGRLVMFEVSGRSLVYRINLDGRAAFLAYRSDPAPVGIDPSSPESLGNAERAWQEWERVNR